MSDVSFSRFEYVKNPMPPFNLSQTPGDNVNTRLKGCCTEFKARGKWLTTTD